MVNRVKGSEEVKKTKTCILFMILLQWWDNREYSWI